MKRLKKIAIISHCILNQNAVVYPLARAKGGFSKILIDYMERDYGLYQLPCPELRYLGMSRKPMTKADYNTEEYLILCKNLALEVIRDLKKYREYGNSIDFLHGIQDSPTCSLSGNRGHFMEFLIEELEGNDFEISYKEVEIDYENY